MILTSASSTGSTVTHAHSRPQVKKALLTEAKLRADRVFALRAIPDRQRTMFGTTILGWIRDPYVVTFFPIITVFQ